MKRQLFFSRDDAASIHRLENLFMRQGHFFIEHKETKLWLTSEHQTTSDPHQALDFSTYGKASTYCVKEGFCEPQGWTITEHIFQE